MLWPKITARGDKAFLSDQRRETEETNSMGKTRALFKKIRDTKGTFHAKMGSIKHRNGMDLTEAEDIKKRWQEYKEPTVRTGHGTADWVQIGKGVRQGLFNLYAEYIM